MLNRRGFLKRVSFTMVFSSSAVSQSHVKTAEYKKLKNQLPLDSHVISKIEIIDLRKNVPEKDLQRPVLHPFFDKLVSKLTQSGDLISTNFESEGKLLRWTHRFKSIESREKWVHACNQNKIEISSFKTTQFFSIKRDSQTNQPYLFERNIGFYI